MTDKTKIEWTDATWNPIRGCSRVSDGCMNCYAEKTAYRFSGVDKDGKPGPYATVINHERKKWNGNVMFVDHMLDWPIRRKKGRMIFVNSMSDLFHENIKEEWIDKIFAVMALSPQHTFQILTKRPERMRDYLSDEKTPFRIAREIDSLDVNIQGKKIKEILKEIPNFPGYFISNHGHVYTASGSVICLYCGNKIEGSAAKKYCSSKCKDNSHYHKKNGKKDKYTAKPSKMSPEIGEDGHMRIMLYQEGKKVRKLVHRLVLTIFDRPAVANEQARHRDSDPTHNHIANLVWGSQSDNWLERKRHGNGRAYSKLNAEEVKNIRLLYRDKKSTKPLADKYNISETQIRNIISGKQWNQKTSIEWPLKNCWMGISVEDQKTANERIPILLDTPSAIRWISAEPLLEQIDLEYLDDGLHDDLHLHFNALDGSAHDGHDTIDGIFGSPNPKLDWVVVGGESGPGARTFDIEWPHRLIRQCGNTNTAIFIKQLGANPNGVNLKHKKGTDMNEWPAHLRIQEYPQKKETP